MSNLSAFLQQNALPIENIKCIVSERFRDENNKPVPWELRALKEDEVDAIRKYCTKKEKLKNGGFQEVTDYNKVGTKMIIESVVFPNLKNSELQSSYNVLGEEKLIRAMLSSGEYSALLEKVHDVSGYDKSIEELVEEAKN